MEDKFSQLYDYLSKNQKYSSLFPEGTTQDSFKQMYVSGERPIGR